MNYFLLKTEPSTFSIDDRARDGETSWGEKRTHGASQGVVDIFEFYEKISDNMNSFCKKGGTIWQNTIFV